jgi:hypothetical protein
MNMISKIIPVWLILLIQSSTTLSQNFQSPGEIFDKQEIMIPMRDGVKLFTAVYTPKDTTKVYPIIITRSPYSSGPYGKESFAKFFGPAFEFIKQGYIFVFQDVRGKFMSEGEYVNMRPHNPNKKSERDIDESSDTYDTIEWLIKNLKFHNSKVGLWGNSYPGFYAIMGAIDAHPNLFAVSPQAAIADWFIGDDMHHNGAMSLLMSFNFFKSFGIPRQQPTTNWPKSVEYVSPDAYHFFLKFGTLKNINENFFMRSIPFWNEIYEHGTYDDFWLSRNILPHLRKVSPSLLIVGGWYDAEDLYGPLNIYKTLKKESPSTNTKLVMGPWTHGSWIWTEGDSLGDMSFGSNTGEYYRENILNPFFNYYLKNEGSISSTNVYAFNTGKNLWGEFSDWPPPFAESLEIFFDDSHLLSLVKPLNSSEDYDEYISDPQKPVPYTANFEDSKNFYNKLFMIEDQRFTSTRTDVLVYESSVLNEDITLAGPVYAELFVSVTGTDADFVVKLIDVFPDDSTNPKPNPNQVEMGGYQRLVRAEIMRGKFRDDYQNPQPFVPGKVTRVSIKLNDAFHTFKKGHRIMVQIQSSWFPFFDRNPQSFVDIYSAEESDFQKAVHRIFHNNEFPSNIKLTVLKDKQ